MDNYQNQLSSTDYLQALRNKLFDFRTNPELASFNREIRSSLNIGPNELTCEGRIAAWQLFLGIDTSSEEYKTHIELFHELVSVSPEKKSVQEQVESTLAKDVNRTFSSLKLFTSDPKQGHNKLFNVLKVYSIYDPDVGYVQGLSFIAAMILLQLRYLQNEQEEQELGWMIFMKVMQVDEWRRLYTQQTPKLFELTKHTREHIIK